MRKGFTLTLTALISAFMVTSALAFGPTVSTVPDVFIGPEAAVGAPAEEGTNTFRYTDALSLWDYVTVGAAEGVPGSTSDTLSWAYAVKAADLSGPTGDFLDPAGSSINYSIIQENGTVADAILPTETAGSVEWVDEINAALGETLADAGALTFRNIRLSPLPEQDTYPAPVASAGLPAGYLDVQEATLYVSDGNTTPGSDEILLVTVESGADSLSGGPVWEGFQTYTDLSSAAGFAISATLGGHVNAGVTLDPSGVSVTPSAGSVVITTPDSQSSSVYYYAVATVDTLSLTEGVLYRASATINGDGSSPIFLFGMNGRTSTGFGYVELVTGAAAAPTAYSAYLVPAMSESATLELAIYDPGTTGGANTATGFEVVKLEDMAALGDGSSVYAETDFTAGTVDGDNWFFSSATYGDAQDPTISAQPAAGGSGSELVITGSTAGTTNRAGFAQFGAKDLFTPTDGKLVVIKGSVTSTTTTPSAIPSLWLNTGQGSLIYGYILDPSAAAGPSATPKDYYVVLDGDSAAGAVQINFAALVDTDAKNGNLRLQSIEAVEYDPPAEN